MTYTWGYFKTAALAKLNVREEQANQLGYLNAFPIYANEAMTRICSGVKAHSIFLSVEALDREWAWDHYRAEFGVYPDARHYDPKLERLDNEYNMQENLFWAKWHTLTFVGVPFEFPEDFISFSDDVSEIMEPPIFVNGIQISSPQFVEAMDEDLQYHGYNQVICKKIGKYKIPYNARWFFFTADMSNEIKITAPADVCDAIPSYMASQCFKADDEVKSAVLRNEFEMMVAAIDDTTFKSQRTLNIRGGW